LPIFEVEDDNIEYNIKFPIIPYNNFYISTSIHEEIDNDIYGIGGFFVSNIDEELLMVTYI